MATNRREFLHAAAVLTAGALPVMVAAAERKRDMSPDTAPQLARVVYDRRHPAAQAFGSALAAHGVTPVPVAGEVHDVWHDDLRLQWQQPGNPVVGMTDFRAFQLLQMMAGDSLRRVALRIHHHVSSAQHEIFAALAHRRELGMRYRREADWPAVTARYLADTPTADLLSREAGNLHRNGSRALTRDALVTWLIA